MQNVSLTITHLGTRAAQFHTEEAHVPLKSFMKRVLAKVTVMTEFALADNPPFSTATNSTKAIF